MDRMALEQGTQTADFTSFHCSVSGNATSQHANERTWTTLPSEPWDGLVSSPALFHNSLGMLQIQVCLCRSSQEACFFTFDWLAMYFCAFSFALSSRRVQNKQNLRQLYAECQGSSWPEVRRSDGDVLVGIFRPPALWPNS